MKTVARGRRSITARGSKRFEPQHRAAIEQSAMRSDEEPMDVKDRQRVDEHIAGPNQSQYVLSVCALANKLPWLSIAPCCARWCRWVEDGGQVAGPEWHGRVRVRHLRRAVQQGAAAVVIQRET